jgi:hypothetical protein
MNITIRTLALLAFIPLVGPSSEAKDKPFESVNRTVRQRTKQEVRWETDLAARDESRKRARALLQSPVTYPARSRSPCSAIEDCKRALKRSASPLQTFAKRGRWQSEVDMQVKFRTVLPPSRSLNGAWRRIF